MSGPEPGPEIEAPLRQHRLRRRLADEVHARPYELLRPPVRASHVAVLTGERAAAEELLHIAALCRHFGAPPPAPGAAFLSQELGALRLRWERHTEFSTYTLLRFDAFAAPFDETALAALPPGWLAGLPGEVLVAAHAAVETIERPMAEIVELFAGKQLIGSRMLGGAALAWTDFRLHGDGFGRFLVRHAGMTRGQAGRLLQRLFEIETYRMIALLAFPLTREIGAAVGRLEGELAGIVGRMAGAEAADERGLLERLTALAAEVESIGAASGYRFSASRAYYAIVRQRIEELREDRLPGTQTVGEFMERRLAPAMKTCESTAERLETLAARVSRAGGLLRTRVDIALEEKNRDLLKSMNRRARLQLRLQETVEGLSVVAISYYLVGLLGYAAKGAKAAGLPVDSDIAAMALLPVVVGGVWLAMRRLRRRLRGEEE